MASRKKAPAAASARKPKGDSPRSKPDKSTSRRETTRAPGGKKRDNFGTTEMKRGSSGV